MFTKFHDFCEIFVEKNKKNFLDYSFSNVGYRMWNDQCRDWFIYRSKIRLDILFQKKKNSIKPATNFDVKKESSKQRMRKSHDLVCWWSKRYEQGPLVIISSVGLEEASGRGKWWSTLMKDLGHAHRKPEQTTQLESSFYRLKRNCRFYFCTHRFVLVFLFYSVGFWTLFMNKYK